MSRPESMRKPSPMRRKMPMKQSLDKSFVMKKPMKQSLNKSMVMKMPMKPSMAKPMIMKMPMKPSMAQMMKPVERSMPIVHPKPLACSMGHTLSLMPKTKERRQCDKCNAPFQMATFARCSATCDFDLCMECASCPNGHLLMKHSSIPQCVLDKFDPGSEIQVTCDVCMEIQAGDAAYFHCHDDCDFDVCLGCGPNMVIQQEEEDVAKAFAEVLQMRKEVDTR